MNISRVIAHHFLKLSKLILFERRIEVGVVLITGRAVELEAFS
jgi:hypothetical protein